MKRLIAFALFSAALAGLIAIERCTSDRSVTSVDAGFLYLNDDAGMWYCGNDGGLPCPNFYTTDIQTEWKIIFNYTADGGVIESEPIGKYLSDKHEMRIEYADGGSCVCSTR